MPSSAAPADIRYLTELLRRLSGLSLTPDKAGLLDARLTPLAERRGFKALAGLVTQLKKGNSLLARDVVDAMTTHESFFFRDPDAFRRIRDVLMPMLLRARASSKRLRIWSAAAAGGHEPYSLAMLFDQMGEDLSGWNVHIDATDISPSVLKEAQAGLYSTADIQRGIPGSLLSAYFQAEAGKWRIARRIHDRVTFREFNLLDSYDGLIEERGAFDVILLRNVLMYFDSATKNDVLARMHGALADDGYLLLGEAESLSGLDIYFMPHPDVRGVYIKSDDRGRQSAGANR